MSVAEAIKLLESEGYSVTKSKNLIDLYAAQPLDVAIRRQIEDASHTSDFTNHVVRNLAHKLGSLALQQQAITYSEIRGASGVEGYTARLIVVKQPKN